MKLEEIEAMLGKITPLPWLDTKVVNVNGVCGLSEYRINNLDIGVDIARCGNDYTFSKADSVFIAAAPTIIRELVERVWKMEEAMTPSSETKAAYMGEFSFKRQDWDDDEGEIIMVDQSVPWTTIKDIMKAIRQRANVKEST